MSQPTHRPLRYIGRGTAATTAEAKAREPAARESRGASRTAAAGLPNARLDAVTAEELRAAQQDPEG
jgi:hypothetical protein